MSPPLPERKTPEMLLSEAVINGDRDEARRLLAEGADPLWADGSGITAFHYAADNGDADILAGLLAAKKDGATARDEDGATPMHYAARKGRVAALELLHTHGGGVNARERDGRTPLMQAAHHDKKDAVEWLLKKKADPNAQDVSKRTALHYAVSRRYLGAAMALVDGGGDATIPDVNGLSALELAQRTNHRLSGDFNVAQFLTAVEVQKTLRHGTTRQIAAPKTARFSQKPQ